MSAPRILLLVLAGVMLTLPATAQSDDASGFDLAGSLGILGGLGWHPSVAATVAVPQSSHIVPYFELGYTPLGNKAFRRDLNNLVSRTYLLDVNAGLQIRAPISRTFAPYFILGAGLLHSSSEVAPNREAASTLTTNDAAFVVGGGVRYYMSRRWGVRPELKVYVSDRKFTRLSLGAFYTFP